MEDCQFLKEEVSHGALGNSQDLESENVDSNPDLADTHLDV